MFQAREFLAPGLDLAAVERFGGDKRAGVADRHARFDRLRSESGKHRREDAAVLQRAERTDVELWHAAEQRGNPVAFRNPALRQNIGKAIYGRAKRCIGEIADAVVAADPAQSKLVAAPGLHMPVDRLVGDVEAAAGKAVKQRPRLRPGKRPWRTRHNRRGWRRRIVFRTFSDSLPFHDWPALPKLHVHIGQL